MGLPYVTAYMNPPRIVEPDGGRSYKSLPRTRINPLDIPTIEEYLAYLRMNCDPNYDNKSNEDINNENSIEQ